MLSDLRDINILELSLASQWTPEHQQGFLTSYAQALASYLDGKLTDHLSPEQKIEADNMLASEKTDEQILSFYKKSIPNIEAKVDEISIEFKKIFLTRLYESYANDVHKEIEDIKQSVLSDTDTTKLLTQKMQEVLQWEHILQLAREDQWSDLHSIIQKIPVTT